MILAGAAADALAVDRVADLRLRAASSIHPGSVFCSTRCTVDLEVGLSLFFHAAPAPSAS